MYGLLSFAAAFALFSGSIQDDVVEAHIALKNKTPEYISKLLMEDRSFRVIRNPTLSWKGGVDELVVRGRLDEVEQVRKVIRLLDADPKHLSLELSIVRLVKDGENTTEEVLIDSRMHAVNDHPLAVNASDPRWESEAKLLPRVNDDGTVSVRMSFNVSVAGEVMKSGTFARRLRPGQTFVIRYYDPQFGLLAVPDWDERQGPLLGKYGYRVEAKLIEVK